MHVHVVVVELVLVLSQQVQALCIYEKYHQRTLDEKYATVYTSLSIQIFTECEQICLRHGVMCVGANVFPSGRYYVCSLFYEIQKPVKDDMMLRTKNGKLILKTRGKS